ncbi:MAG: hypothetical protein LBG46_01600 [Elusimicrobiota bacterium]|jgi:hypothetical protein|nr:hypothetical protein [Elusimicrobiota bacterium]
MSNDWMAKAVFPLLILFLALEVFSHLDTITITDRLIEIGETPVFEKSEIAKISIQKIEGYISKEGIKTLHSL